MTNEDIFIQILSEASGQPKEAIKEMSDAIYRLIGSRFKLDEELPDDKAKELLATLRSDLPGVRAWLIHGGLMANPGGTKGTA